MKHVFMESIPSGKTLLEDAYWLQYTLEEDSDGKTPKLIGKFGQTGVPTANGRVYTEQIMRREIERLSSTATEGGLYGTLDHPKDGQTRLREASHLIKDMSIDESGAIMGTIHLIPGTDGGDQALAIAKAGGRLGISSRGVGTAVPDGKGNHIVQEDFRLLAFDIVANPANEGAHPNFVIESLEDGNMTLEELKTQNKELYDALMAEARKYITSDVERDARENAKAALSAEFEQQMEDAAEAIKAEAIEEAKNELLSDPAVAGAVKAMESIREIVTPFILSEDENKEFAAMNEKLVDMQKKLSESDEEYKKLEHEAQEVSAIAKELGFRMYINTELAECDDIDRVYEMLGDLQQYENVEAVKDKVDAIVKMMEDEAEKTAARDAEILKLKEENKKLSEAKEEYLKLSHRLSARVYAERKLGMRTDRDEIMDLIEERDIVEKDEIDKLVESRTSKNRQSSEEYLAVRKGLEGGTEEDDGNSLEEHDQGDQFTNAMNELIESIG